MKPLIFIEKGQIIDYQTIIEETIGDWISQLKIYDANFDCKTEINGKEIEKDRAYFVADADYELVVRKKRKSKYQ